MLNVTDGAKVRERVKVKEVVRGARSGLIGRRERA